MAHGPSTDWGEDRASGTKSRVGILMFFFYAAIYFGFVIVNTLSPTSMELPLFGQSISVVYGIGLIVLALIMALVYNGISARAERHSGTGEEQ